MLRHGSQGDVLMRTCGDGVTSQIWAPRDGRDIIEDDNINEGYIYSQTNVSTRSTQCQKTIHQSTSGVNYLGTHRGGQGRKPVYPEDYVGKKEVNRWIDWAEGRGMRPLGVGKRANMLRAFFVFSHASDICADFCDPYILNGRIQICGQCKLKGKKVPRKTVGKTLPRDITWHNLEGWKTFLKNAPMRPTAKDLKAGADAKFRRGSTINDNIDAVVSWFEMKSDTTKKTMHLNRFVEAKAVSKMANVYKRSYQPIPLQDLFDMMETAEGEDYEDYAVLMLLLYTAGRAQFYGLRVDQIEWGKENGDTTEGMNPEDIGWITTVTKFGKPIRVPLHPKLQKVLKVHLTTRDYDSKMLFRYGRDTSRVGVTILDFNTNEQVPWRMIKRLAEKVGLKNNVTTHMIRKTVGKYGRQLGFDTKFMQRIMTHEDPSTTLKTYTEVDDDDLGMAWAEINFEDLLKGKNQHPDVNLINKNLDAIVKVMPQEYQAPMKSMVEGMKGLIKVAMGEK